MLRFLSKFFQKETPVLEPKREFGSVNLGLRRIPDSHAIPSIDNLICELSLLLMENKQEEFKQYAFENKDIAGIKDLPYLRIRFHAPPKEPEETNKYPFALGNWMAACQWSIFEMIYNMGIEAKPFLEEVAYGEYDWTQATAIQVLFRFVLDGLLDESYLDKIDSELDYMREETYHYLAQSLIPMEKEDKRVSALINKLENESFQEILQRMKLGK